MMMWMNGHGIRGTCGCTRGAGGDMEYTDLTNGNGLWDAPAVRGHGIHGFNGWARIIPLGFKINRICKDR